MLRCGSRVLGSRLASFAATCSKQRECASATLTSSCSEATHDVVGAAVQRRTLFSSTVPLLQSALSGSPDEERVKARLSKLIDELQQKVAAKIEKPVLTFQQVEAMMPPDMLDWVRRRSHKPLKMILAEVQAARSVRGGQAGFQVKHDGRGIRIFPSNQAAHAQAAAREGNGGPQHPVGSRLVSVGSAPPPQAPNQPSSLNGVSIAMGPVDFCYHVSLKTVPPPASLDIHRTEETVKDALKSQQDAVLSMQHFVALIPPFFVPVLDLLTVLEGYTEEHIDAYFGRSRSIQLVTVDGRRFIRLFGGYTKLDMDDQVEAIERFKSWEPNPALCEPYIKAFTNIRNTWMPLRQLIDRGGPEAAAAIPFPGPQSILFFAQFQHIFAFAVDNGGAVQLREDGYNKLDLDTSPIPVPIKTMMDVLEDEIMDFKSFIENLEDRYKEEMLRFFPSIEAAVEAHRPVLYLDKEAGVIMRARVKEREDVKKLPLEKQLEIALFKQDKRKVRQIRKKMAIQSDPDNPLLNKDNLAREVLNYVPRTGYITLLALSRRTLPTEYLDFMGNNHLAFFKLYPNLFQIFEVDQAGRWCISRAGVPQPQGVLRQDYTEEEALRVVAATIQRRGSMSTNGVALLVPQGVRDFIKKHYTNIFYFCTKYTEYFQVLKRSETENAQSSAIVSLIKMPTEGSGQGYGAEGSAAPHDDGPSPFDE